MTAVTESDDTPLTPTELAAAQEYHAPPSSVPRDAMWSAIQARRATPAAAPVERLETPTSGPVLTVTRIRQRLLLNRRAWALCAIAASAIVAVAITNRPQTRDRAEASEDTATAGVAWQVASSEHFIAAEGMLTAFTTADGAQTDRQQGAQVAAWSRDLLASTRLLLDSPAGRDAQRRALLLDLELVLVQLVESGPARQIEDRSVMDDLLSRSALLLTRIRTSVPVGAVTLQNASTER